MKTLRLILGDQLNHRHSWYQGPQDDFIYLLMEVRQETDYVNHHIQKVVAFFLAMRAFADFLEKKNNHVIYLKLDSPKNLHSFHENIRSVIAEHDIEKVEYQLPDEYRIDVQLSNLCADLSIPSQVYDTEHFLTERNELSNFFEGKKTYLMESFYRFMRKKYDILMDGSKPITGKWNYDKENRKKLAAKVKIPAPKEFNRNVTTVVEMIDVHGVSYIGRIDKENFIWPVTRAEGLELLNFFIEFLLPSFGLFQDATHPYEWSLFHSRLSFLINVKLICPLEVIKKVEEAYHQRDEVTISQAEGFIRQILGWREYMRGVYWAHMPAYADLNFFSHNRKLPSWFWTGKTKMHCVSHAIEQSLDYAYAHHIQRLMITGNFTLLAGIHPDEVDAWYLGIYIDSLQWVEITNTRGMSQYADGGIVGTKPYVSSANYIDKMGHYCKSCHYNKKIKNGDRACPFNSLYWHFYDRHDALLRKNPRIGMMYRIWDKMKVEDKESILTQADNYLENIEKL